MDKTLFHNNKMNLLIPWLEDLYLLTNHFLCFHQIFFGNSLQHKHLYFIKSYLALVY